MGFLRLLGFGRKSHKVPSYAGPGPIPADEAAALFAEFDSKMEDPDAFTPTPSKVEVRTSTASGTNWEGFPR